jgi:hypothetical protein
LKVQTYDARTNFKTANLRPKEEIYYLIIFEAHYGDTLSLILLATLRSQKR